MPRIGPGTHVQIGAQVLAAAEIVDTRLVARRLSAFAAMHRRYLAAQRKVEVAERQLRGAQIQLARRDGVQDAAIDGLARALIGDGDPRNNPFKSFRVPSPARVMRLAVAEEAKLIHRLAAAVQQRGDVSNTTRQAARAADQAARAIEAALALIDKQQLILRELRRRRDAIGSNWKAALGALKRSARTAADEGAPRLHAALFGGLRKSARAKRKRKRSGAPSTTTAVPA